LQKRRKRVGVMCSTKLKKMGKFNKGKNGMAPEGRTKDLCIRDQTWERFLGAVLF